MANGLDSTGRQALYDRIVAECLHDDDSNAVNRNQDPAGQRQDINPCLERGLVHIWVPVWRISLNARFKLDNGNENSNDTKSSVYHYLVKNMCAICRVIKYIHEKEQMTGD